jgi:hypothetical protein
MQEPVVKVSEQSVSGQCGESPTLYSCRHAAGPLLQPERGLPGRGPLRAAVPGLQGPSAAADLPRERRHHLRGAPGRACAGPRAAA